MDIQGHVDLALSAWQIILRARQQHLFSKYVSENPKAGDVLATASQAYDAYVKKNLPLVGDAEPSRFQEQAEKAYSAVLRGEALDQSKKPGDAEAKIKMHINTVRTAVQAIEEASKNPGKTELEGFHAQIRDILYPYLDAQQGQSVGGEEYSIFAKLTKQFEDSFMQDMRNLNNLDPDELTRVTKYMQPIVDFIQQVVDKKLAYATSDGSVYFDIGAFEAAGNPYARLEPWNRGDLGLLADGEGSLIKKVTEKRSQADFALWKASRPGEPRWPSPWGYGRPGWHIECSAMASDKFGQQMDIHSGGIDLAFPHHDNELAQSEAYWNTQHHREQWVNYFLHMGHLSIQGAKMAKSLKNFTTIKEALGRGDWTPRSLRIVFLLGTWNDGIEITPDLVKEGNAFEEKVNNFFLGARDLIGSEKRSQGSNETLITELEAAKVSFHGALCDSFNTPEALAVISRLITKYNNSDKRTVDPQAIHAVASWITSMLNTFGLNGNNGPESPEVGWQGIDVPEHARPYLTSISSMRDALRQEVKSKSGLTAERLREIATHSEADETVSKDAQPYADALADVRHRVVDLSESDNASKDVLALCDEIRDVKLFDLGIYLEDKDDGRALVRPLTKDVKQRVLQNREDKAAEARRKQLEREKREKEAQEKAAKGKMRPQDMFKTAEFGAWNEEGLPTKDADGKELAKSRIKKLMKDWDRQKKAHETWLAGQPKE